MSKGCSVFTLKIDAEDHGFRTAGDRLQLVRVDARTLAVLGRRRLVLPAEHTGSTRDLHVSLRHRAGITCA